MSGHESISVDDDIWGMFAQFRIEDGDDVNNDDGVDTCNSNSNMNSNSNVGVGLGVGVLTHVRASARGNSLATLPTPYARTAGAESTVALVCDYCSSSDVNLDDGNYVCRKCSSVVCRFIDHSPEWRYFGAEDNRGTDPTRCGPPVSDLMPSLGSTMHPTGRESSSMRMVQKYQFWNSMTYRERMLYSVFDQLTVNAAGNGISQCIIEEAKVLYKKFTDAKISRGEGRQALIASSIYMACKSNGVPRSVKEIANMFNIKPTTMTKGCKLFQQMMMSSSSNPSRIKSSAPDDFIGRFCSRLVQDVGVRELCRYIVNRAEDVGVVCESTPPSIVAGAIQMCNVVLKLGITKVQLSDACHISQVTITKCYKRIAEYRDMLMPPDLNAFLRAVRKEPALAHRFEASAHDSHDTAESSEATPVHNECAM